MLEVTWLMARKDINSSSSIATLIADGIPNWYPYLSPFTNNEFLRYFKIMRSRKILMTPQKPKTFKLSRNFGNKKMLQNVDMDGTSYYARRGNRFLMTRSYGIPINYTGTSVPGEWNSTCLGPQHLVGLKSDYISYYRMDDATNDTNIVANLPSLLPSSNTKFTAVLYHNESPNEWGAPQQVQVVT